MDKEIKKAQKGFTPEEELPKSDTLTAEKMLKKYPKKTVKTERALLKSLKKNVEIQEKKLKTPHGHKRTTPGSVEGQPGAPAFPKVEGTRWNKTLNLQSKTKGKALVRKLSKKK